MFSAVLLCVAICAAPQDSAHLVIVATTDVHGHATAVDSLRQRYPGSVILVDAGDLIQGDPFSDFFSGVGARDRPVLRILGISDFDGALAPTAEVGGAAELKTALDTLTAACDCLTIRVSAGDQLQGSLLADLGYGRTSVAVLNELGLDVAIVGPGDLAWSLDTLRQRIADSRYPWVMTNVFDPAAGARPLWVRPSVSIDGGTVQVAILGYLSPALVPEPAANQQAALEIRGGPAALRDAANGVRDRGADVVILLAQASGSCDAGECRSEVFELAHLLDGAGIDLILAGGPAGPVDTTVAGIRIMQPAGQGTAIAVADLMPATDGWRWHGGITSVNPGTLPPDSAVGASLARYQLEADSTLDQVVARFKLPLPNKDGPSALGRVVSDAFRNSLRSDVALVPSDEIRAGLPAGQVTYGDLLQALPTRHRVVAVRLSGSDLLTLLEGVVAMTLPDMHLSGAVVEFDGGRPVGRRIRDVRLLDGREIRDKDQYSLAIPETLLKDDRLANLESLGAMAVGVPDVDALAQYLPRLQQPVNPPSGRRFKPVD
jgi:5'-nucleotidase/UDP-sugar diphosphatase